MIIASFTAARRTWRERGYFRGPRARASKYANAVAGYVMSIGALVAAIGILQLDAGYGLLGLTFMTIPPLVFWEDEHSDPDFL